METKERIMQLIAALGMSKAEFERVCGLSNGYINSIRKTIGSKGAEQIIAKFPQVNKPWLVFGEGEMLRSPITQTATGHHINQSVGDSGLAEQLEKANREIERLQSQLAKAQEQNDRLLKIIENMSK